MQEKTYEIYLRPITVEDNADIIRWRNSDNVRKYFISQTNLTEESQTAWIKNKVETGQVIQFIIIEKATNHAIGTVYLRDIDRVNKKAEYGIFIGEELCRGKGYGTQAAELMLMHAFDKEGLHRIYLRVLEDNARAIASYTKVGFNVEGVFKHDVSILGKYKNIVWMAIINPKENAQ